MRARKGVRNRVERILVISYREFLFFFARAETTVSRGRKKNGTEIAERI